MQKSMEPLETHNTIILSSNLPDQWQLLCAYTDTNLIITSFKLDGSTKLVVKYEQFPEKLQILAESFADLATLLTTSNGIRVQEYCLVIDCIIGQKNKSLKIKMKQEEISEKEQILNLRKLLEKEKKTYVQQKLKYQKTINQLIKEKNSEKSANNEIKTRLNEFMIENEKQKQLISSLHLHYVCCANWTCGKQLIIPMNVLHSPPIHKWGNKYICGKKCEFE